MMTENTSSEKSAARTYQSRYQTAKSKAVSRLLADPKVKQQYDALFAEERKAAGFPTDEERAAQKQERDRARKQAQLAALAAELGIDVPAAPTVG